MDFTTIHPSSANQSHLIDLHLWRGAPKNSDENNPIQILVNHGYIVGFSHEMLQPAWSAYRVAYADDDVDYDRPLFYYDDMRLEEDFRIGRKTFGKVGGIQLHVGHMTPNEVINRQFGRLAQMETFLMSNMSPQYGSLNTGVWLKLENAIREIKDEPKIKDHVWVIVGPIFGSEPVSVKRGRNKYLPVPESYFCITVDPHSYPFDTPSRVHIDCFVIPQDAPKDSFPDDYPATLDEIEELTNLKFFEGWAREQPIGQIDSVTEQIANESRLMGVLKQNRDNQKPEEIESSQTRETAKSIDDLIESLKAKAAKIQVQSKILAEEELEQLNTIQHTISYLLQAKGFSKEIDSVEQQNSTNFITYKILSDRGGKLKKAARTACNFWNRFIEPKTPVVIQLGTFTRFNGTVAAAYYPRDYNGVRYGKVKFNTRRLREYTDEQIVGTLIHEIAHTLGIGWNQWKELFDEKTGKFNEEAVSKFSKLSDMVVELDGGSGTALSHWDEEIFDKELMTGIKDKFGEHVLPITIEIMKAFGHKVVETLEAKTDLAQLINEASSVVFSRQDEIKQVDLSYEFDSDLMETIPHS